MAFVLDLDFGTTQLVIVTLFVIVPFIVSSHYDATWIATPAITLLLTLAFTLFVTLVVGQLITSIVDLVTSTVTLLSCSLL